jgi:hypothetical protein
MYVVLVTFSAMQFDGQAGDANIKKTKNHREK